MNNTLIDLIGVKKKKPAAQCSVYFNKGLGMYFVSITKAIILRSL